MTLKLSLNEHPHGVEVGAGNRIVYDVARNEASLGPARVEGRALVWELGDGGDGLLSAEIRLDPGTEYLLRSDRVDFPPGGVAYRHTHPGPGIRYLLQGSIRIESEGRSTSYGPGEAWFEPGPEPVFAAASETGETAFVRVMILPREWEGKRTVRYVSPEDAEKPKTQRATVFLEAPVER